MEIKDELEISSHIEDHMLWCYKFTPIPKINCKNQQTRQHFMQALTNFNPESEHPFEFPHSLRPGKIINQNT